MFWARKSVGAQLNRGPITKPTDQIFEDVIEKGCEIGAVKFVCIDGEFFGLEAIVCKRSDYLCAAFSNTIVETNKKAINVGKNKEIVKKVLRYLHTDKITYNDPEMFDLIEISKIWLLPGPEKTKAGSFTLFGKPKSMHFPTLLIC